MECESRELQLRREREQNRDKDNVIPQVQAKVNLLELDPPRSSREILSKSQAGNDNVCAYLVCFYPCQCVMQVHIDKKGAYEHSSMKLTWRQGKPAPENMSHCSGTAVVHGRMAYFSCMKRVYSYTVSEYDWLALAVINDKLTTIGGCRWLTCLSSLLGFSTELTNSLSSLSGGSWIAVIPPMPTKRMMARVASIPTHLVVAGGLERYLGSGLPTIDILNTETLQWSTAGSLPVVSSFSQVILCKGSLYVSNFHLYKNSVLLKSCKPVTNSSDGGSVWTELADAVPAHRSSIVTLRGCMLAIGGAEYSSGYDPTGAIHCYNVTANSWSVIGEMPTPRYETLAVVLPSNELVVVGGSLSRDYDEKCSITNIANYS